MRMPRNGKDETRQHVRYSKSIWIPRQQNIGESMWKPDTEVIQKAKNMFDIQKAWVFQ